MQPELEAAPHDLRVIADPTRREILRLLLDHGRLGVTDLATRLDLRWHHRPEQGATRVFASRALLFGDADVIIETGDTDLHCTYDASDRYIECTSASPGEKHLLVYSR